MTFNCLILTLAILLATGPVRQCVAQLHQLLQNNSEKKKKTKGIKVYIFATYCKTFFINGIFLIHSLSSASFGVLHFPRLYAVHFDLGI